MLWCPKQSLNYQEIVLILIEKASVLCTSFTLVWILYLLQRHISNWKNLWQLQSNKFAFCTSNLWIFILIRLREKERCKISPFQSENTTACLRSLNDVSTLSNSCSLFRFLSKAVFRNWSQCSLTRALICQCTEKQMRSLLLIAYPLVFILLSFLEIVQTGLIIFVTYTCTFAVLFDKWNYYLPTGSADVLLAFSISI